MLFLPLSLVSFVVAPLAGRFSARFPVRYFLGGGLAIVGVSLLLMRGLTLSSTASALIPGFIVGGIGVGMVNAPLAATAVSVVAPQRAGMASGINNTFRQVGIATGIAALGALFQSRIGSSLVSYGLPRSFAPAVASGHLPANRIPPGVIGAVTDARHSFINGMNSILLVAAIVLFVGAVLAFALVREKDFVASGPAPVGH